MSKARNSRYVALEVGDTLILKRGEEPLVFTKIIRTLNSYAYSSHLKFERTTRKGYYALHNSKVKPMKELKVDKIWSLLRGTTTERWYKATEQELKQFHKDAALCEQRNAILFERAQQKKERIKRLKEALDAV